MYFTSQLMNCFHVMKFALRGQVCFEKCILQRLSQSTRVVGSHSVQDNFSVSKNSFIRTYVGDGKNDFNDSSKCLFKSTDFAHTSWSHEHSSHNPHAWGHEPGSSSSNGGGDHGWSLASVLALSLISTKTEGEEKKKESELIIMIKRGILALKVGCQALLQ